MSDFDGKAIENYCKDKLYRPFLRKMQYLYFNPEYKENILVFSNTEDIDFKYCESLQTTGLVKIINRQHLAMFYNWFDRCGITRAIPMLIYFGTFMTLLSKVSWGTPTYTIKRTSDGCVFFSIKESIDILIARPCDTHFTLTKLQSYVEKYSDVFFTPKQPSYQLQIPETSTPNKMQRVPLSCEELRARGFLNTTCRDINLLLLPGQDVLLIKSLLQKNIPFESGVRIWSDTSLKCLNYGGYYTDADISLCVVRDNVFLFPKTKPE